MIGRPCRRMISSVSRVSAPESYMRKVQVMSDQDLEILEDLVRARICGPVATVGIHDSRPDPCSYSTRGIRRVRSRVMRASSLFSI